MKRAVPVAVAAFAAYIAIAIAITFPLVARLTTYFPGNPGDNDVFGFIWNNWWVSHALVHLHRSPFVTDYRFAPFDVDLRLHTFGALYGFLSTPVTILGGPVLALNLQIFGTIALNGYSAFALARYLTADDRAAFLAGLLVAATPAINFHMVMGRVSCAAVWPAVLSILFFLRLLDRPALSRAVPLILSVWAVLAADQQIALYGLVWLGVLTCTLAPFRVSRLTAPTLAGAVALRSTTAFRQMIRSGTSIGANANEAQEGQTKPDFIAKMSVSRKEAREANFWLSFAVATGMVSAAEIAWELQESLELLPMIRKAIRTARTRSDGGNSDWSV